MPFKQEIKAGGKVIHLTDTITAPKFLIVASRGVGRTGKSTFAASMPNKIGWLPLDANSRWAAETEAKKGAQIIMPQEEIMRVEDPSALEAMEKDQQISFYLEHMKLIRGIYSAYLANDAIKSVFIDTGGQLNEDVLFSHFGRKTTGETKAYGAPRQTFKDSFITPANKNILFAHHARPRYNGKDKVADEYEMDGLSKLPDWVNCEIEHFHLANQTEAERLYVLRGGQHPDNKRPDPKKKEPWVAGAFGVRILNATMNMSLVGKCLLGDECTFEWLMHSVSPELHGRYYA